MLTDPQKHSNHLNNFAYKTREMLKISLIKLITLSGIINNNIIEYTLFYVSVFNSHCFIYRFLFLLRSKTFLIYKMKIRPSITNLIQLQIQKYRCECARQEQKQLINVLHE